MTGEYDIALLNSGLDMLYEALMRTRSSLQCSHSCAATTHFLVAHDDSDKVAHESIERAIKNGSLACGECR